MPELPEVETVRRTLAPLLEGRTAISTWRSALALRRERPDVPALDAALTGAVAQPVFVRPLRTP